MTQQELNQRIDAINALTDEPRKMYQQAAQLYKEGQHVGLFMQGTALMLMDKNWDALRAFLQYAALEPDDSEGWQYAGMAAAAAEDTEQALKLLTRAVDMGNMNAACTYASLMVSKGIDLRNKAARMMNTDAYDKTNDQAISCLFEALDIYCFLAQQMPDKLETGDWALLQNSIGSLYMLAINNQFESATAKMQLLNSQGLAAGKAMHDHSNSRAAAELLAGKLEQVACIMERAGRKADAAMTRCRRCVELCDKTKDAQAMLNAEGFWEYAMQEAQRTLGDEKEDWLEYYESLKTDYMRLHRQFEGKLCAMKRKGMTPHMTGGMAVESAPQGQVMATENPLAAPAAPVQNRRSGRSENKQYQRSVLTEALDILRDGFPGIYMFTVVGAIIGGIVQTGIGKGNAMITTIYVVGLLIAAVGVIKSLKRNPGIREKLIALALHVIIWLLMSYLLLPTMLVAVIAAAIMWVKSGQAPASRHTAAGAAAQAPRAAGMPGEIRDANQNIWRLQSNNGDFSTYYNQYGQTENIHHHTVNGSYAYGDSGLSFHW